MREPYEKPTVQVVDLGNMIDGAERMAGEAQVAHEKAKVQLEGLGYELLQIEGELAEARGMVVHAKDVLRKVQELQGEKG